MDAKEERKILENHFKAYDDICNQLDEQRYKWVELKNELYGIKPINYSGIPSSSSGKDMTLIFLERIEEVENKIRGLNACKLEIQEKHLKEINYLDSLDSRRIIREIFLNHHNTSDLEKLMNYNRSNIYKLKKDAYSQFANLIQKWTTLDSIG